MSSRALPSQLRIHLQVKQVPPILASRDNSTEADRLHVRVYERLKRQIVAMVSNKTMPIALDSPNYMP